MATAPRLTREKLGANIDEDGVRFRVWAQHDDVEVVWTTASGATLAQPLEGERGGTFTGWVAGLGAGARYHYRVADQLLPDPASRFQPDGVHGASMVVDPRAFRWRDRSWRGVARGDLVIYELHVGTFSDQGTFAAVEQRLPYLKGLGVTAIELMPVAEFAGRRNWGYDGVDLFAPSHHYGVPDDLRRLVDAAHGNGLGVILDVVYNHLGPDGAYLTAFAPDYFTARHQTPWGNALNLDGPGSEHVREFFLQNALHWIDEYHVDGLRLDATHALKDDSERHFLAELSETVRTMRPDALLVAEDERNDVTLACPRERGGFGLDAIWADDFHHQVRRHVAGDAEGYYASYRGSAADIATTINEGWFFSGQVAAHTGEPRGTDPQPLAFEQFVYCVQNHDQVGNRARGERLNHEIDPPIWRAVSALLLLAPETPMIFMGQEWAASSPFCFFTDHHAELGRAVTEGRRAEFGAFAAFSDPATRATIPDPQDEETFARSRLDWSEKEHGEHARTLRLYTALLALRRTETALRSAERDGARAEALDDHTIAIWRSARQGPAILALVRLAGAGSVSVPSSDEDRASALRWRTIMTTEDEPFAVGGSVPHVTIDRGALQIEFARPGAIVLRAE